MKLLEQLRKLERLDRLIRMRATGRPGELASRLRLSERQVYNLLNDLRTLGAEISYDHHSRSYRYDKHIRFNFRIVAEN